jgi:hypothetical protein
MSQPAAGEVHVDGYGEPKKKGKKGKKGKKRLKKSRVDLTTPIWKNDAQHIVYGVVLAPEHRDSQGDIVSAEEIEKAAHRYLVDSRKSDVQHSEEQAAVDVIESYVAPQDFVIAGEHVSKGSWVMAHKVHDPAVWKDVQSGKLTGLSIGGSAIRLAEGDPA